MVKAFDVTVNQYGNLTYKIDSMSEAIFKRFQKSGAWQCRHGLQKLRNHYGNKRFDFSCAAVNKGIFSSL
jgi:hypothetical protein